MVTIFSILVGMAIGTHASTLKERHWNPVLHGPVKLRVAGASKSQLQDIKFAMQIWNHTMGYTVFKLGRRVNKPLKDPCQSWARTIVYMSYKELQQCRRKYGGDNLIAGMATPISQTVWMPNVLPYARSYEGHLSVMIHELGHVLWLKHTRDPADIMYPTALKGQVIGRATLDQLAALGFFKEDKKEEGHNCENH